MSEADLGAPATLPAESEAGAESAADRTNAWAERVPLSEAAAESAAVRDCVNNRAAASDAGALSAAARVAAVALRCATSDADAASEQVRVKLRDDLEAVSVAGALSDVGRLRA